MGDRYSWDAKCPKCGATIEVYYAPSCEITTARCLACGGVFNIEQSFSLVKQKDAKAGDTVCEGSKVGTPEAILVKPASHASEGSTPSPGSPTAEDEKAFADLWALLEWAWKQGGGYFTNMTDAAYLAHWHLRRRLTGTESLPKTKGD